MATIDWPIILDLALNKFVNDNKIIRKMLTDDGQIPNNQKLPVKGPKLYGRTRPTLSYLSGRSLDEEEIGLRIVSFC